MAMAAPTGRIAVGNQRDLEATFDVTRMECIGRGTFGHVNKVTDKQGKLYAMKTMYKGISEGLNQSIKREKFALERFNHPNIVKLQFIFETPQDVHLVFHFMPYRDLFHWCDHCYHGKGLKEASIQFYAAELISALEYMRHRGFVHRDVKSENILMSETLHIKLTDFGTAKKIKDKQGMVIADPSSLVGTRIFIAPEILNRSPVTYGTDLWGLAVVLSDMMWNDWICQKRPRETDYFWYRRISLGEYRIPDSRPRNPELEDLFKKLTCLLPSMRLGICDMEELKTHPFFHGIDWDNLLHTPVPPIEHPVVDPNVAIHPEDIPQPLDRPEREAGVYSYKYVSIFMSMDRQGNEDFRQDQDDDESVSSLDLSLSLSSPEASPRPLVPQRSPLVPQRSPGEGQGQGPPRRKISAAGLSFNLSRQRSGSQEEFLLEDRDQDQEWEASQTPPNEPVGEEDRGTCCGLFHFVLGRLDNLRNTIRQNMW